MAVIVLRSVKGSPLTLAEADANFSNLNTEVGTKLDFAAYTPADILTKIKTVDGSDSGLDADLLDGLNTSSSDTSGNTVVTRSSGNFSAGTITASLIGNVTGNVLGNLTGTVTGNATNVSGIVSINNGGTGATTQLDARNALGLGTISTQASNNVNITGGSITGITDLGIGDGGTGASNIIQARTNLGLIIGQDIQPFSSELSGLATGSTGIGFHVRTGTATVTQRSVAVGGNGLSVTNANGVSGNPTISILTNAAMELDALTVRTINVTGAANAVTIGNTLTVSGATVLNGGLTMDTNKFTVADTTGNTLIGGTLGVTGTTTLAAVNTGAITTTGAITATGNITAFFSDDRLKTRLGKIENALDKICSLEGFYFEPNQVAQDLGYTGEKQVGVSAQQVQAVLPEVVFPAPIDAKYLTVDYSKIVPLIIEAIKEIREEIKLLK